VNASAPLANARVNTMKRMADYYYKPAGKGQKAMEVV
jgi:hypothetical protein